MMLPSLLKLLQVRQAPSHERKLYINKPEFCWSQYKLANVI